MLRNVKNLGLFILIGSSNLLNASEHRVVLHGHANHFEKLDRTGKSFNEKNYGIGYEYNNYNDLQTNSYISPIYGLSANIIKDSTSNIFPFAGAFGELRTRGYIGFGLSISAFVGYKRINKIHKSLRYDDAGRPHITYKKTGSKRIVMGGASPGIKLYVGDFSLNYNYSPRVSYKSIYAEGFHYFSLSYKFN